MLEIKKPSTDMVEKKLPKPAPEKEKPQPGELVRVNPGRLDRIRGD